MATQLWTHLEEKKGSLLLLTDGQVHFLKVSGNSLTLKRNFRNVLEKLQQGAAPGAAGASQVVRLDATTVSKAAVEPGNRTLRLVGPGETPEKIKYRSDKADADAILAAILAESGRTFEPSQEPIGVAEALIAPGVVGIVGTLLCLGLWDSASGKQVQISGRRQGAKRMLAGIGETLGTTGVLALATLLALLVGFWTTRMITHRPQRTVLLPATA